jgi:hypothetical protein
LGEFFVTSSFNLSNSERIVGYKIRYALSYILEQG